MAYDPLEGFRKAAETYSGPATTAPNTPRSQWAPWVLGTEAGPPKSMMTPTYPEPTAIEQANWAKAQADFNKPEQPAWSASSLAPFRVTNPITDIGQAYDRAGGGLAGVGAVIGDRVRAGWTGVKEAANPDTSSVAPFTQGFRQGLTGAPAVISPNSASAFTDSAVREPPSKLEVVPPTLQAVTPTLTSVGAGYGVDSGPAQPGGATIKHYYGPDGNIVASGVSSASSRGGFVGAATDAEAARNLQDRAAQDQAAQAMVASLNRGAEAERNTRAERLGISRDVLDQMEGRPTPPSLFDAPQQITQDTTPFSRPGDGFGDAELRQARMQRDIEGAKGRKKDALVAQYAAEFTKPAHAGGGQNPSDDRLKLYLNQLDRMDKSRDRAVDNARADQSLELQRAQLRESQIQGQYNRDRGATEFLQNQSNDRLKLGENRLNYSTQAAQRFVDDFKGQVDLTAVKNYGRRLIADPRLAQVDPGLAQRVRDNVLTYEDLHALKKMADAGRDPTHWYNPVSWFSDAPTPSQTVDKVYLNR